MTQPQDSWPRRRDPAWFAALPLHKLLGLRLEEARPGFARVVMTGTPLTMAGVGGSVHGGVLSALVDIAMLAALGPMFDDRDQPAGTADLNITYLRPAHGKEITVDATVIKKGRQLAVTEVEVRDPEGRLCAKGRTLYAIRAGGER